MDMKTVIKSDICFDSIAEGKRNIDRDEFRL